MSEDIFSLFESIKNKDKMELPKDPNDTILFIDGMNSYLRCFCCVPTHNDNGIHIGGLTGFLQSVGKAIRQFNPTRCVIVFDGAGGSVRRRKLYPQYKENRRVRNRLNRTYDFLSLEDEREAQKRQLIRSVQYLQLLPVTLMMYENVEADDVIAYMTSQLLTPENNRKSIIMTSDKDFVQLVDERVNIWNPIRKLYLTPENVPDIYKIPAHNFLLYRIMDGDDSDNIKGVKGVGMKTLQNKFPEMFTESCVSIEDIIERSDGQKDSAKIFRDILEQKDTLELNHKLMQLGDVDISGTTKSKIRELFHKPVRTIDKLNFQKMFMDDKLWAAFPNVNSWLTTTFSTLDSFAQATHT